MKIFGYSAVVVGMILLVLSFAWISMFPAEEVWTESQAKEHADATALYHRLRHTVGGAHRHGPLGSQGKSSKQYTKADLAAAKLRWETSYAALQEAQGRGQSTKIWLRFGGIAVAAVGAGTLGAEKRRASRNAAQKTRR